MNELLIKGSSHRRKSTVVYAVMVEDLSHQIRCGSLAPGQRLPGEASLSSHFGISRSSVRLGLDFLEQAGQIVKHPGKGTFVRDPSETPRAPSSPLHTIGINVMDHAGIQENWYDSKIVSALLPFCQAHRQRLSIINQSQLVSCCPDFINAAILLYYEGTAEELLMLQRSGLRLILFNRIFTHEKLSYVSVNYRYESTQAVAMLQARGHDRIGIIASNQWHSGNIMGLRELGYLDAMGQDDFLPSTTCFVDRNLTTAYYAREIEDFLRHHGSSFSALFIPNGSLAVPTFLACSRLGIRVPEDLTLLCFDDIAYLFDTYQIPFFYIKMPLGDMARDAAAYLEETLKNPSLPALKRLYHVSIFECQ